MISVATLGGTEVRTRSWLIELLGSAAVCGVAWLMEKAVTRASRA